MVPNANTQPRKSQLAIEHCYRTTEQSPDTWVFWAHASNTARLEQSFRQIADQVKVRGRRDPQADVFKLVHDWLRDANNGRWLLVLDNADDAAALSPTDDGSKLIGALQQHLSSYLPPSQHGSVLVTSRTKRAATQVVEDSDIILIEPMHDAAAHALLRKKLGIVEEEKGSIAQLATTLDRMPLALVQAAAYIRERAPRCSVQQYLKKYQQSDSAKTNLLNQEAGHLRRDRAASNSVLITWQISFDYIRKTRQSAVDLLSLASFFDRQVLPKTLLRIQDSGAVSDDVGPADFDDEFEDDILMLRDYSLITIAADEKTFEMHSLVQLATRRWLQSQDQACVWLKVALNVLAAAFPSGQPETWAICRILLPHATKVLDHAIDTDDEAKLDRATIATKVAWYLMLIGEYANAEYNARTAVMARQKLLEPGHKDTFISISCLGSVLERQGKYDEAEAMHRQALRGYEIVLGQEHHYTIIGTNNLGSVLWNQGKYNEAEAMHRRALQGSEKVFGREHEDTLRTVSYLGSVLERQGKYNESEAMHRQALRGYEMVLGQEHPDTLLSVDNLGLVLLSQGKYEEAEAIQQRALEGSEKVLGIGHHHTHISASRLGMVLSGQGKRNEAEVMHRRALQGYEKVLGQEHPDTLTSVSQLGAVLESQGKYEEAEAMYRRALQGKETVLGRQHPDTITSVSDFGLLLESQGKYDEAEAMHQRALQGYEEALGQEHPYTLTSVDNLGLVLWKKDKYEAAVAMFQRVLEGRKNVLGPQHPHTLLSEERLRKTYVKLPFYLLAKRYS
jgi:tetratricopeptide (TPR) repeat protein